MSSLVVWHYQRDAKATVFLSDRPNRGYIDCSKAHWCQIIRYMTFGGDFSYNWTVLGNFLSLFYMYILILGQQKNDFSCSRNNTYGREGFSVFYEGGSSVCIAFSPQRSIIKIIQFTASFISQKSNLWMMFHFVIWLNCLILFSLILYSSFFKNPVISQQWLCWTAINNEVVQGLAYESAQVTNKWKINDVFACNWERSKTAFVGMENELVDAIIFSFSRMQLNTVSAWNLLWKKFGGI